MNVRRVRNGMGLELPLLGQGTWKLGDVPERREAEIRALRTGLDLGLTLIDTAEMYGSGRAEELVGEAIQGRRHEVVVVTKVLPQNASRAGVPKACEGSLRRLRTDRIDLYLLHWRGRHPLSETVEAFERLRSEGKILHWGVSNFDVADLEELRRCPNGDRAAANQLYFNLHHRGIERKLLPWCQSRGVTVMAYTPFEQGKLRESGALGDVARRHGASVYQVALAWILHHEGVAAIPKSGSERHVRENAASMNLALSEEDLAALNRAYPAPSRDVPLETT